MQWVTIRRFKAHNNFDFRGMKNKIHRNCVYVHRLEDVWANCGDEDVRRLDFKCLTHEQIENLDLAKIPDIWEVTTDDIVDPIYFKNNIANTPLPLIQWSQKRKHIHFCKIFPHHGKYQCMAAEERHKDEANPYKLW